VLSDTGFWSKTRRHREQAEKCRDTSSMNTLCHRTGVRSSGSTVSSNTAVRAGGRIGIDKCVGREKISSERQTRRGGRMSIGRASASGDLVVRCCRSKTNRGSKEGARSASSQSWNRCRSRMATRSRGEESTRKKKAAPSSDTKHSETPYDGFRS